MDKKEHLKAMLVNIVHDKNEEAAVDFHNYLQVRMREIVNPQAAVETTDPEEITNNDPEITDPTDD